jgi:hypothetical protein
VIYAAVAIVAFAAGALTGAWVLAFWWGRNLRRARRGGSFPYGRERVGS